MLFALDVGNTNTVLALYNLELDRPGDLVANWRVTTQKTQTADEFGVLILSLLSLHKIDPAAVTGVIISSVVPPLDSTLRRVSERYFKIKPLFVEPGIKTGMPLLIDNPAELGADRVANGVAAFERYGGPCVVVDFGTATSFDVVSEKGEFLGGVIAPGLGISADALFSHAARLARVNIKKPAKAIGTNTVTNLQSGIFYGYIGLVDGILERVIDELRATSNSAPKVIATGGLANLIADDSKYITGVDHLLTLDGLRLIYQRNLTQKHAPRARRMKETAS
ncbi:Pantothenate kinase type III, CoaX-like [Acidisarcina polymorpha]|uniref:Type III pantothenate kinase n=1 Tax=Acidisarcina polymorpha TaxID=2211140 RepID=A0A2Z5G953_9BACT|nr:type III pantothenate kinase [Acidisarcina polymorpha]AXC15337.1 Pantothenate kinase type III, CoaX-like [Acidisarcina polymorpha]